MRAAVGILATTAATAAVFATAGAGAPLAPATGTAVTTVAAAKRYVRSLGLDPASFVVQVGTRNYAGESCPGRAWACTKARRVIQLARQGGENRFECEPASDGTDEETGACVIVQSSPSGNTARCVIRTTDVPGAERSCSITQTSAGGDNKAVVEMDVHQSEGSDQDASLEAEVSQTSVTGGNQLHASQTVQQIAKQHGGTVAQDQSGDLSLVVDQSSETGDQLVQMHQSLDQHADATGSVLGGSQEQFGNLFGNVDQSSAGRSHIHARQSERQNEHAPEGAAVVQSQIGPEFCCTSQTGNPGNRFNIDQSAEQSATQGEAFQSEFINGSCLSDGTCDVDQAARNNVDRATNSCTGSACFIFISCTAGEEPGEESVLRFPAFRRHEPEPCITGEGE